MWTSRAERWRVYNLRRPIAPSFVYQQQQQPNRAINIQIEIKLDEGSTKPLKVLLKSNFISKWLSLLIKVLTMGQT